MVREDTTDARPDNQTVVASDGSIESRASPNALTTEQLTELALRLREAWLFREYLSVPSSGSVTAVVENTTDHDVRIVEQTIEPDVDVSVQIRANPTIDAAGTVFSSLPLGIDSGSVPDPPLTVEYGGSYTSGAGGVPFDSVEAEGPKTPSAVPGAFSRLGPGAGLEIELSGEGSQVEVGVGFVIDTRP